MYRPSALALAAAFALTGCSLTGDRGGPDARASCVDGEVAASGPYPSYACVDGEGSTSGRYPSQAIEDTLLAASQHGFQLAQNGARSRDGPYDRWLAVEVP